jgi:hypothetical protein
LEWSGAEFTITEATKWLLYQPRIMMNDDECGAIGGMLAREEGITRRKLVPEPLVHHKSHMT